MKLKTLFTFCIFVGALFFTAVMDAEARRMGGGRSFGSSPSMQRSAPAPQKPGVTQTAPSKNSPSTSNKSGFLGGMGGMLGGILAGTLLGSLLFGGDFDGGGFMDILLIGLLLFIAYKVFTMFRRRNMATASPGGGYGAAQYQAAPTPPHSSSSSSYQKTSHNSGAQGSWSNLQGGSASHAPAGSSVPAGFDVEDFLAGAKMAFTRLQASWDKRDLDDIALFTTPVVLNEIKAQYAEDPEPGLTEILLTNARLLDVKEENGNQWATVYFDVLMRENDSNMSAGAKDTTQVREIWHFMRPINSSEMWKLDGIQQVEG